MAGKAAVQEQETNGAEAGQPIEVVLGEAIATPSLAGQALADILKVRLSNLGAAQLKEDAVACGAAVRAAFDELDKPAEGK
ncbi:hypothetical protein NJH78_05310 [Pseudomonas chlororaphis]|uniref:hypothetical protein n=1 Tax=Pseudomonas chlororaphis TaxID=587753 RepID=UPI00209A8AE3|nr:hypothetical protein [Pseudomonas chlororaphis]MCO7569384.1 hypothetical protein [Pseudomonas chlororaphis]MCO7586771.1 hypothetical protein [Pseudomonas chlororaphis]